jgi:hypothetical protein
MAVNKVDASPQPLKARWVVVNLRVEGSKQMESSA